MDHGPAVELGVDHAAKRKSRLGIWLFVFYTIVYGVFVAIGVVNYEAMSISYTDKIVTSHAQSASCLELD